MLYTLWVIPLAMSRRALTWERLGELQAFVAAHPDRLNEISTHFAHGTTLLYAGRLDEARTAFERALARWETGLHGALARVHGDDHGVFSIVYLMWLELRAGRLDASRQHGQRLLELVDTFKDPLAEAMVLAFMALAAHDVGDEATCQAHADRAIAVSDAQGFYFWGALGHICRGWTRMRAGDHANGLAEIVGGLGFFDLIAQKLPLTYWKGYLVEACLLSGDTARGLAAVEEALAMSAENADSFNEAELLRLQGELFAAAAPPGGGVPDAAIDRLERAGHVARGGGASFLELRAATSLARAMAKRRDGQSARATLGDVLGRIDGGVDTAHVCAARDVVAGAQG